MKVRVQHLAQRISDNRFLLSLFVFTALPGLALAIGSFRLENWWQDIALNGGFLLLGVALTVFLVDTLVARHEDQRWSPVNTIASIRLRRFATNFIDSDGTMCLDTEGTGEFFVSAWKSRVDPGNYQMELFQNPNWIAYVKSNIVPAARLETGHSEESMRHLIESLNWYHLRVQELLGLFPHSASPTQAANLAGILDEIPEQIHLMTAHANGNNNFTTPDLSQIVSRSLDLVVEVNRNPQTRLRSLWFETEEDQSDSGMTLG